MNMDASDVKISHVFDNIKAQVYKRNKEIYAPVEAKKIGLEKLSPFLENIQTVSNHNLAYKITNILEWPRKHRHWTNN